MSADHTCSLQPLDDVMEKEWDSLALSCGAAPYMRPGWFRAWMRAFRPSRNLHLLSGRQAGKLVAVLPLLPTPLGFSAPINAETPGFEPLSTNNSAIRAMVPRLLGSAKRVDLQFMPAGEMEQALVAVARERDYRVTRKVIRRSPYANVDENWEAVRSEVLSRSRRKGIARSRRELARLGELSYSVHSGGEDLQSLLGEALALEAAGWKGAEGTAILSRPATSQFYQEIGTWAQDLGLLRLHFLRLGGKLIAFKLTLEQSGVLYSLKTSYDEQLRRYGPGILLTDDVLSYASEQPDLRRVAITGEDDPHKLEFATGVDEQLKVSLFSSGLVGTASWMHNAAMERLRTEARQHLSASTKARVARLARSTGLLR